MRQVHAKHPEYHVEAPFWLEGPIERLHIHPTASHGWDTVFDTSCGSIFVGQEAFFGHRCLVIAGAHDYKLFGKARGDSRVVHRLDIVIEEGVWVASGAKITGPCLIGEHAVVTIGTIVRGIVPAYALIGPGEAHEGKSWKIIGDVREQMPKQPWETRN